MELTAPSARAIHPCATPTPPDPKTLACCTTPGRFRLRRTVDDGPVAGVCSDVVANANARWFREAWELAHAGEYRQMVRPTPSLPHTRAKEMCGLVLQSYPYRIERWLRTCSHVVCRVLRVS